LDAEEACKNCGIRAVYITKVPVRDVELLEEQKPKEEQKPIPMTAADAEADKPYEPDFARGPIEG